MRLYQVLLVTAVSAVATTSALAAEQHDILTIISSHAVARRHPRTTRMLRIDAVDGSKDDDDDGDDGDDEQDSEERGGRLPGLTDFVKKSKAKISSTLSSTQKKVAQWAQADGSVDDLKVILKLNNKVTDDAFMTAKNYKLYDQTVTAQLPVWSKNGLTPDDVLAKLGIAQLSEQVLARNPNYKYYLNYIVTQVPIWTEKGLTPKEVLKMLGMGSFTQKTLTFSPNFKYYSEFVSQMTPIWIKNGLGPDDVKVLLGVDKLSKEALEASSSQSLYYNYMRAQLTEWALKRVPDDEVAAKLGLAGLSAAKIEAHSNGQYLAMFVERKDNLLVNYWLSQDTSTRTVWLELGLEMVKASALKSTDNFKLYAKYVNRVEDMGVHSMESKRAVPLMISEIGSPAEMAAKTEIWATAGRSKEYVQYVLGLSKLEGTALTSDGNYQYYQQFLAHLEKAQKP